MAIADGIAFAPTRQDQALPAKPHAAGQVEGALEGVHGDSDRQL
jgi:hypothetical protein